ncbi:MAG TPA: hypothetical protein VGI40_20940 [Pirellulaceae bacterium]
MNSTPVAARQFDGRALGAGGQFVRSGDVLNVAGSWRCWFGWRGDGQVGAEAEDEVGAGLADAGE